MATRKKKAQARLANGYFHEQLESVGQARFEIVVVLPIDALASGQRELGDAVDVIRRYGSFEFRSVATIDSRHPDWIGPR